MFHAGAGGTKINELMTIRQDEAGQQRRFRRLLKLIGQTRVAQRKLHLRLAEHIG